MNLPTTGNPAAPAGNYGVAGIYFEEIMRTFILVRQIKKDVAGALFSAYCLKNSRAKHFSRCRVALCTEALEALFPELRSRPARIKIDVRKSSAPGFMKLSFDAAMPRVICGMYAFRLYAGTLKTLSSMVTPRGLLWFRVTAED